MGNGRISQMRVGFQVGPPTRVFDAEVGQDGHGKPADKKNSQQMQWLQ
jgi:hypothetical protein